MTALRYSLGSLRGLPVEAHASLLILSGILALRNTHDLADAVVLFLLLLGAVFCHEVSHAAMAAWRGYRARQLSLHAFGGLDTINPPPATATDDIMITLAGPGGSVLVGSLAATLGTVLQPLWPGAVLRTAGLLSLSWGMFNLLPAFPMDGGRLLRRILSRRHGMVPATVMALRISPVVLSLVALHGLFTRTFGWIALAGYLYLLHLGGAARWLQEANDTADAATVSPPPYVRKRPRRVDISRHR